MKQKPAKQPDELLEIFALIAAGGDACRQLAAELIRQLSPESRRDIRAICQETDALLDTVILAEMAERRPWRL